MTSEESENETKPEVKPPPPREMQGNGITETRSGEPRVDPRVRSVQKRIQTKKQ